MPKKKMDYAKGALSLMGIARNGRNQEVARYINALNSTRFNFAGYATNFLVIG